MIRGYSAEAVRAAEAPLLEAGEPLMLRAAALIADAVTVQLDREAAAPARASRVLVLAGAGANGGDGLHAGALLSRRGMEVDAILTAGRHHAGGAEALQRAGGSLHELAALPAEQLRHLVAGADAVLDAILGIGSRPEVPAPLRPLLELLAELDVPLLAVDVPSFIDATSGQAATEALRARRTLTLGAVKAGLLLPGAAEHAGRIDLFDIGIAPHLPEPDVLRLEDADLREHWPMPTPSDHKYSRGVVALAAGSAAFPGAAVLACSAAARAGAGMVRLIAPREVIGLVLHSRPEIVGHEQTGLELDLAQIGRVHALVVGPGLPAEDPRVRAGIDLLRCADDGAAPVGAGVIDAGGLDALETTDRFGPDTVLTPHRGEADRLADRLGITAADSAATSSPLPAAQLARALASATGATVLLKGAVTVVAPPHGPLLAQQDGPPQLATAGTGDVLAGILGTLLAAGVPGRRAAALAALLHGRAGQLASRDGRVPLVAHDLAETLPAALAAILAGAEL